MATVAFSCAPGWVTFTRCSVEANSPTPPAPPIWNRRIQTPALSALPAGSPVGFVALGTAPLPFHTIT